jgi:hypothetical protein
LSTILFEAKGRNGKLSMVSLYLAQNFVSARNPIVLKTKAFLILYMHTMIIINTGTMNFETIKKDERLIIILND